MGLSIFDPAMEPCQKHQKSLPRGRMRVFVFKTGEKSHSVNFWSTIIRNKADFNPLEDCSGTADRPQKTPFGLFSALNSEGCTYMQGDVKFLAYQINSKAWS